MPLQFLDDADPVPASNIWLSLSLPMCLPYPPRSNEKYKQSARTSAGADKWLDVRVWDNTAECVEAVKGAGVVIGLFDSLIRSSHRRKCVASLMTPSSGLHEEQWFDNWSLRRRGSS
eukprot:scaffold20282_cov18-Tisochrysis_lutea.AAC.1